MMKHNLLLDGCRKIVLFLQKYWRWFIHLFKKYSMNDYYVSGIVLRTGSKMKKTGIISTLINLTVKLRKWM